MKVNLKKQRNRNFMIVTLTLKKERKNDINFRLDNHNNKKSDKSRFCDERDLSVRKMKEVHE